MLKIIRASFDLWSVIGSVIGAISIANLSIMFFEMGYAVVLDRLFNAYQWLAHDILLGSIINLFKISVPQYFYDSLALWMVCAFISIRTINRVRNYYIDSEINSRRLHDIGEIETAIFSLPHTSFFILNTIFNLIFWPVAFVRFWFGDKRFLIKVPKIDTKEVLFLNFGLSINEINERKRKRLTYKEFWAGQMALTFSVAILLLITNAGLPTPQG